MKTIAELCNTLSSPGPALRSAPFWGWNDRLNPDELRRQLSDMKEKGMGGVFIHSREGLETPYLSSEWMKDVRVSVDRAAAEEMEIWLYDEDKWPSGSAGGLVSASNPERFTAKGLTLEILESCQVPTADSFGVHTVGIYSAEIQGNRLLQLGSGPQTIILRSEISGNSEWYNGFAPPDNLNPDAVRKFLELTHEAYRKAFGGIFPETVKGFFTDEPDCCDFYASFTPGRPWLPWTQDFIRYFTQKRGYDPTDRLPLLFFHGEGSPKIRHDYWRTISDLFSESYMKQVYDYCEANGLESTGHVLYENDLGYNIRVCGAAMPQYRYLHRPGIDILGEQSREYLTVRQCSSVANQYGRPNTITETYGCTGWEFDFEGQKWLGDWQFLNGITRRCQHLALYSITGCRKRDYPPVFQYQNTWWEYNRQMEDYFARLTACVQVGSILRDILVIHPITGLWTLCGCDPQEDLNRVEMNMGWTDRHIMQLNELGNRYNRLTETLVRNHLDFDFGDETILAEIGSVEGRLLRVGQQTYRTIVVPEVLSLFESTAKLLQQFAAAGGTILWMGKVPELLEGAPSDLLLQLAKLPGVQNLSDDEALLTALNYCRSHSALSVTGGEDSDILTMLRKTEDGFVLTAANHDRTKSHFVRFRLPCIGAVTAYDLWGNTHTSLPCSLTSNGIQFAETLAPAQTRVYLIETGKIPVSGTIQLPYEHPHRADPVFAALGPVCEVKRCQPNALVLDRCRWRLEDNIFSDETEIWMAQRDLRSQLNMPHVYYNGAPQRYTWLRKPAPAGKPFTLQMHVSVRDVPARPCYLAVEKPQDLTLTCNGHKCALTAQWYSDRAMLCFILPTLQAGENTLELSGVYTRERELEDMFLLGDFAVSNTRELIHEPGTLHFGDWCTQGYPHYSGAMDYRFTLPDFQPDGRRIHLHLGDYQAAVSEILVNGQSAGLLFGRSRTTVDITDFLLPTDNRLTVKLIATPRNLYGPFHQTYTGCSRISWADFRTEGAFHTDAYVLVPYGLMGQITLTYSE